MLVNGKTKLFSFEYLKRLFHTVERVDLIEILVTLASENTSDVSIKSQDASEVINFKTNKNSPIVKIDHINNEKAGMLANTSDASEQNKMIFEMEVKHLKERLTEMEYFKTKVKELEVKFDEKDKINNDLTNRIGTLTSELTCLLKNQQTLQLQLQGFMNSNTEKLKDENTSVTKKRRKFLWFF